MHIQRNFRFKKINKEKKIKRLRQTVINKKLSESKNLWLRKRKYEKYLLNPKEDNIQHQRPLQDKIRREILKFAGKEIITIEDFKNHFNLISSNLKFHLLVLERAIFIEKVNKGWKATPKGVNCLKNFEAKKSC